MLQEFYTLAEKDPAIITTGTSKALDEFRERLTLEIAAMLHHDYTGLLNLLYRVDVSEQKFREAVASQPSHLLAGSVADLIIARLIEKARIRKKYSE